MYHTTLTVIWLNQNEYKLYQCIVYKQQRCLTSFCSLHRCNQHVLMYQTHILITHLYNLKLIDLHQLLNTIYLHRVSEGVQILSESAMFQKYHGENKLHFDQILMLSLCAVTHIPPLGNIMSITSQPIFGLSSLMFRGQSSKY